MIIDIQNKAKGLFAELGYPLKKDEGWQYTNLDCFSKCVTTDNQIDLSYNNSIYIDHAINIVVMNGKIIKGIDNATDGISILQISNEDSNQLLGKFLEISDFTESGVIAHNTAEFSDALHISVDKTFNSKIPVNIINIAKDLNSDEVVFPRFYFHAKDGSIAKFFIQHINHNSQGSTNSVSEFYCEESSSIEIIHSTKSKDQNFLDTLSFLQEDNSSIKFLSSSFGGDLYRSNIDIDINGENCSNNFGILMLGSDTNHIDYHANVNHKIGNSVSNFLCRSLLRDKARGVFNGKILVEENASGTSATLNNNNLLLSDLAAMQSNPQLEINCEDVKCAHGSTSGNLDQDALFYLCSRGISISKAYEILIKGFTSKLLDSFDTVDLSLDQQIKDWIENE